MLQQPLQFFFLHINAYYVVEDMKHFYANNYFNLIYTT